MFKTRQFKRKKSLLIIFVLLIIFSAVFFGYKILTENKLARFDIETQNLSCTNSQEITVFLQSKNLNYFYFKADSLESELKNKFFCIGKIESEVSYPDKLKLKISGREGKFVVNSIEGVDSNPQIVLSQDQMSATQSTTEAFPLKIMNQIINTYKEASPGAMFLVDEEGMVFESVGSNVAFPRLSIFSQDFKIGQKIPDDVIKKTAEIVEKLKETEIPSDNLILVGDKLIIDSKPRIIFSLDRGQDRQAASLQLILRQAKMNLDPRSGDMRSVESIDLRFDRPVVVYSKK